MLISSKFSPVLVSLGSFKAYTLKKNNLQILKEKSIQIQKSVYLQVIISINSGIQNREIVLKRKVTFSPHIHWTFLIAFVYTHLFPKKSMCERICSKSELIQLKKMPFPEYNYSYMKLFWWYASSIYKLQLWLDLDIPKETLF